MYARTTPQCEDSSLADSLNSRHQLFYRFDIVQIYGCFGFVFWQGRVGDDCVSQKGIEKSAFFLRFQPAPIIQKYEIVQSACAGVTQFSGLSVIDDLETKFFRQRSDVRQRLKERRIF